MPVKHSLALRNNHQQRILISIYAEQFNVTYVCITATYDTKASSVTTTQEGAVKRAERNDKGPPFPPYPSSSSLFLWNLCGISKLNTETVGSRGTFHNPNTNC